MSQLSLLVRPAPSPLLRVRHILLLPANLTFLGFYVACCQCLHLIGCLIWECFYRRIETGLPMITPALQLST